MARSNGEVDLALAPTARWAIQGYGRTRPQLFFRKSGNPSLSSFITLLSVSALPPVLVEGPRISLTRPGHFGMIQHRTLLYFLFPTTDCPIHHPPVCYYLARVWLQKPKFQKKIPAPAWRLKSRRNKNRIATTVCKWRDESNEPN